MSTRTYYCKRVLQTKEINNFNERSNILRGKNKNKYNALLLVSGTAAALPEFHRNRNKVHMNKSLPPMHT